MTENPHITFIGGGNMASAMLKGILASGIAEPEQITVSAPTQATRDRLTEAFGIEAVSDNRAAALKADVLILAVKPAVLDMVLPEISGSVRPDALVISIAAGRSISDLKKGFGAGRTSEAPASIEAEADFDPSFGEADPKETEKKPHTTSEVVRIIRVMPNTPALVGEGMSALSCDDDGSVSKEDKEYALKLFSSFGRASFVPEKLMDAVTGVSGSSPAFVYMFIEAMADAAVAAGMPRQQAYTFAAQSVYGSAKMVLKTGLHPGVLKDQVTSPAGTTIAGVRSLEENGFRGTVMDAVLAAVEKSRRM